LRALYWLCGASVLVVLWQACYWLFINPESFASPAVQITYWGVSVAVAVVAMWAKLLRRRRLFGIACLAGAALHVCVGGLFNLAMAGSDPVGGTLNVLRTWDLTTWSYCWNWMAILVNAAACFYLLRYELPRWLRGQDVRRQGFQIGTGEPSNR